MRRGQNDTAIADAESSRPLQVGETWGSFWPSEGGLAAFGLLARDTAAIDRRVRLIA